MRIAPLGAYFADDLKAVTAQAIRASEVAHQHPEGIAGGVAVAHAAAVAAKAREIDITEEAAYVLGNGSRVTAQDTVPFALWVAAHHLDDYRTAITTCVQAGGDIDTTAAIVGGIIGTAPQQWRDEREPLLDWMDR